MEAFLNMEERTVPPSFPLPPTPQDKFVSVFKIDGEPILPPLMTVEKRYEMQMYREKACQLEQKYLTQQMGKRVQFNETQLGESPRSQLECIVSESSSQRSFDEIDIPKQSDSEKSCSVKSFMNITSPKILVNAACNTDTLQQQSTLTSYTDCSTNTMAYSNDKQLSERIKKLSRSETVVFDNVNSMIIKPLTAKEEAQAREENFRRQQTIKENEIRMRKLEQLANLNCKLLNLPLQQKSLPYTGVPSICVNPPTPLDGPNSHCDSQSGIESIESFDTSGFQTSPAAHKQSVEITEDSTDDSCNTQSTEHVRLVTSKKKITGITARILKFEQNENKSSQELSNEDNLFTLRTPQRSATSPSLKSLCDTIDTNSLSPSPRTEDTSSHSLVRSSSFTLDGPSKALLDHIKQQNDQAACKIDNVGNRECAGQVMVKQNNAHSPNSWRDTVESKAKRVQKKTNSKPSLRATSHQRCKSKPTSFNNYPSSTNQLWNNPLPPQSKIKKSPYDAKIPTAAQSKPTHSKNTATYKQSSAAKQPKSHVVKKSASSTTYTVRQGNLRHGTSGNRSSTSPEKTDVMSEIENRHRQRLHALIAQQQEEHRRLQHQFEAQQKMLIDQLNNDMCRVNVNESNATSTPLLSPSLLVEGVRIGLGSPFKALTVNGNSANIFNGPAATNLNCASPTISATNSYMSPNLGGVVGGFTATTTLLPSELNLDTSSLCSTITERSVQRSHGSLNKSAANNNNASCSNDNKNSPKKSIKDFEKERRTAAVSTINAYTRGFLVRRLFQTEQIQRIVQTIRDTLIFVLNLHMETMQDAKESNTEANIKLKARLLQQLSSASRTLHLIFFQTSIKERMEIISRDRKRIKTKLLSISLKRSPRIT